MAARQAVLAPQAVPSDGRQSDRALQVRRGMSRHFRAFGCSLLPEVVLANGRRADLVTLEPDGTLWIIEIKSSLADLQADRKWHDYLPFCDRFAFATLPDVPAEAFPAEAGLYVADAYGAACVRDASTAPLAGARRKALLLLFARTASDRLMRLSDPPLGDNAVY